MNAQSKLERLLSSFENDTDSISGDVGWMYYGDVDPKDAAADLARITAERDALKIELQATAKHKLRDGSFCWCDKAEYEMNPEYEHAAFCRAHRVALKQSS